MADGAEYRKKVRQLAIKELEHAGGVNFTKLGNSAVAKLFGNYDSVFFGNTLAKEIADAGGRLQFKAHVRNAGYASVVGFNPATNEYYLDMAPNVLNAILVRKGGVFPEVFGESVEKDMLQAMMFAMESSIVYIAMILWKQLKLGNLDDPSYGVGGTLAQCVLSKWFGHTLDKEMYLSTVHIESIPKSITGRYTYWSNSCYMDSLLTVLFNCQANFWRSKMLETNVETQWKDTKHKVNICEVTKGSTIDTIPKVIELGKRVQTQLNEDFTELKENKRIK